MSATCQLLGDVWCRRTFRPQWIIPFPGAKVHFEKRKHLGKDMAIRFRAIRNKHKDKCVEGDCYFKGNLASCLELHSQTFGVHMPTAVWPMGPSTPYLQSQDSLDTSSQNCREDCTGLSWYSGLHTFWTIVKITFLCQYTCSTQSTHTLIHTHTYPHPCAHTSSYGYTHAPTHSHIYVSKTPFLKMITYPNICNAFWYFPWRELANYGPWANFGLWLLYLWPVS